MTRMSRIVTAVTLGLTALSAPAVQAAEATFTAHIDLVSRYILRGATTTYGNGAPLGNKGADAPESDKPALQWGADYVMPNGIYLGYFGSQINYSYKQLGKSYTDRSITDFQGKKSIEHDFYGGYTGSVGDIGFNIGGTYYYYLNGKASNAFESKLALTYGPFTLSAQTLFSDTVWGNKGDTYWSAVYSTPLMAGITFTANLGYYTYKKEGKYLGTTDTLTGTACAANEAFVVNGCFAGTRPVSGAFRHLILGITQPIGSTGLTWGAQAIIGGDNRYGIEQKSKGVLTLAYGF